MLQSWYKKNDKSAKSAEFYSLIGQTCQLATLYFVARQVAHKRGNTRNNVFQLAMQQCCETS